MSGKIEGSRQGRPEGDPVGPQPLCGHQLAHGFDVGPESCGEGRGDGRKVGNGCSQGRHGSVSGHSEVGQRCKDFLNAVADHRVDGAVVPGDIDLTFELDGAFQSLELFNGLDNLNRVVFWKLSVLSAIVLLIWVSGRHRRECQNNEKCRKHFRNFI